MLLRGKAAAMDSFLQMFQASPFLFVSTLSLLVFITIFFFTNPRRKIPLPARPERVSHYRQHDDDGPADSPWPRPPGQALRRAAPPQNGICPFCRSFNSRNGQRSPSSSRQAYLQIALQTLQQLT
ncbi:hypothetical protein Patl1_36543 [Pistacia atlantica]|nr:hypothetical protein Patl1_36543 [Pistacia atlantica]